MNNELFIKGDQAKYGWMPASVQIFGGKISLSGENLSASTKVLGYLAKEMRSLNVRAKIVRSSENSGIALLFVLLLLLKYLF
jgi:hypothetical protein